MSLPTLVILVDHRERRPLPFPETIELATALPSSHAVRRYAVKTKPKRLLTADYALDDDIGSVYQHGGFVVVETKRSLDELSQNVLSPHGREKFIKLLRRLRELHAGWIIIEGGLASLYPSTCGGNVPPYNPVCARDHFLSLCCQYRVHPYILEGSGLAARQRVADFVVRLLVYGGAPDAANPPSPLREQRSGEPVLPVIDGHQPVRPAP